MCWLINLRTSLNFDSKKFFKENYDCLVFCVRDDLPIKILNFIELICPYSCDYSYSIEIPDNSKLKAIDKNAFCYSQIKRIKIPE